MDRRARGARDEALAQLDPAVRESIPIIFTAHSLPRPVVDRDPGYITQLRDTANAVADALHLDASAGALRTRVPATHPRNG